MKGDASMFQEIRGLLHKEPFEPFRIVTNSGEKYAVENPDNVAFSESRISIFPPKTARWILIRLNQITALESLHESA
jgi:hypothetical protein